MDEAELRQQYRQTWNVPDWATIDGYRHVQKLTPDLLRWEFLRRMPEYRAAWEDRAHHHSFEFKLQDMVNPAYSGTTVVAEVKFIETDLAGARLDTEWFREQAAATQIDPNLIQLAITSGDFAWHGDEQAQSAAIRDAIASDAKLVGEAVLDLIKLGYEFFVFDPRRPIKPQCTRVEDKLYDIAKAAAARRWSRNKLTFKTQISKRKPRSDFDIINGLRCLDAENEYVFLNGSTEKLNMSLIARQIFPPSEAKGEDKKAHFAVHNLYKQSLAAAKSYAYRK